MQSKYDFQSVCNNNPIAQVLERLFNRKVDANGKFLCVAPDHNERTASGHVYKSRKGERWKCFGCGKTGDVIELVELGMGVSSVEAMEILEGKAPLRDPVQPPTPPRVEEPQADLVVTTDAPADTPIPLAHQPVKGVWNKTNTKECWLAGNGPVDWVHVYRHPFDQSIALVVLRWDKTATTKKEMRPLRWGLDTGRWHNMGFDHEDTNRPIYNQGTGVQFKSRVLVVEGEKCVDVAQALMPGWHVVTWHGGSKAVLRYNWNVLAGCDVVLWPDNDPDSIEAMGKLARRLTKKGEEFLTDKVRTVVPPEDRKKGWDIADAAVELHQAAQGSLEQFMLSLIPPPPPPAPVQPSSRPPALNAGLAWVPQRSRFDTTEKGLAKGSLHNISLYLRHHPNFKDEHGRSRFTYDEFECEVLCDGAPMTGLKDMDIMDELATIDTKLTTNNRKALQDLVSDIAQLTVTSSMRAIFDSLPAWDEVHRVAPRNGSSGFMARYTSCTVDEYTANVGMRWLVGAVRRVYEPGFQHDSMLVLEGEEGIGKTSLFRVLGRVGGKNAYGESGANLGNGDKDNVQGLRGKLIVELAEMSAHRKSEAGAFKDFITRDVDNIRPSYGTRTVQLKRQCVFAGTTNVLQNYLTDPSGNRRIWPVHVRAIRRDLLAEEVEQVWAEAKHLALVEREQNYLTKAEEAVWKGYIDARRSIDPWEDRIEANLRKSPGATVHYQETVWFEWLNMTARERDRRAHDRLVLVMDKMGWELKRGGGNTGDRAMAWRPKRVSRRPRGT